MKRYSIYMIVVLWCVAGLTGCGRSETGVRTEETSTELVDWKEAGFAITGEIEERQDFWVQEFIPWEHENVIFDSETEEVLSLDINSIVSDIGVYDGKIYRLNTIISPPYIQAVRWVLEIYDTDAMESSVREFSYEQLGLETGKDSYLLDMDLVDGESFVFQWAETGVNPEGLVHQTASRMIYSNLEGDVHITDLWDIYLEKRIARESYSQYTVLPQGYCVCDSRGNTYARAGESDYGYTRLYVLDRNGNILLEYQASPEQAIEEPMRTEGGELVFPVYDAKEKRYDFMWPDIEKCEMRTLAVMSDAQRIKQMYGMQGNSVYYEVNDGIVKWNIESGSRVLVFCYQDNGIESGYRSMLALREGQAPLLRLYRNVSGQQEDWLVPLSEEEVSREEAVLVADLVGDNPGSRQVSECAALVSRRDLNETFVYESAGQNPEDFKTQILAELAAGGGPDILYVSRSDMEMMYEKGLLLDLRDLIPGETLEKLLPGVLELGTMDGQLVGMAGNVSAIGMAVSCDTWAEDTWSLEDIVELMEEGRLEGGVYYSGAETYFAPLAAVSMLIKYNLENSFLIDWETRECHFDDERFIRLLEVTNIDREALSDESGTWLKEGMRAAFLSLGSSNGIYEFDTFLERENGHYVGFPTEGVCGNYLDTTGVLVVNVNTADLEAVNKYLEYFLGDEIQGICDTGLSPALSVRKLSLEEIEQDADGRYLWRGEELSVFDDGTTAFHRAKAFLDSCASAPRLYPELNNIIYEELEAMYAGDKNPGQVAEIINNRIQTYLDEGN